MCHSNMLETRLTTVALFTFQLYRNFVDDSRKEQFVEVSFEVIYGAWAPLLLMGCHISWR